uniref:Kelch domain containing 2 n=1 Tax=Zonotrichia albicollis TaxID=44394 RepID=A0A8D2MMJ8_ZONAL
QVLNGADCAGGRHGSVGSTNAQVRGFYDFYLPRDEIWIYNMETGRWKKSRTEGDVPPSMSGSCAVCVDRVLYLFGGHHARGNTNKFYMLNARSTDRVLQWVRVECQGVPPSCKDKLGVWVHKNRLSQGVCPVGRSWHSLTPISSDHLFLFGGFTTNKQPLSDAWIYCISKNEWVQFEHNYSEKPRLWHTACASEEGEVIIFGGCANNLLAHSKAAHSNEILVFSLQPRSLVRLCLEAVICFKELLASSWHCLPKHLLHSVNQRFGSNNTSGS